MQADLAIVVGNSLNSISTSRWAMKLPPILQVDCDPQMIGRRYPVANGVVGDARDALARLAGTLAGTGAAHPGRQAWVADLQAALAGWREEVFAPRGTETHLLSPRTVMKILSETFDDDSVLIYDAGNPGIWAQMIPVQRPRGFMKPVGFGAMGFALPAAVATSLASPGRDVCCVIGDGSFAMTLGEIETAVREKAKAVAVIFNDRAFGNIKQLQSKQFGQRHIGVDVGDVRYGDVATAMGAAGERVCDPEAFRAALLRGKAHAGLYVVDALIDPSDSIWNDPF